MITIGKYSRPKRFTTSKPLQFKYNRNHFIKAPKVLVIDEDGEQLGEMDTKEAISLAMEKELDLIEVAPNATPPVTKIMSWSKFKYTQEKKKKESKGKSIDQKEMWFKVFIEKGDMEHKLKRVREFLKKKHPVKLTIRPKGRVSRENITGLMTRILENLGDEVIYDNQPKYEGRNYAIIVRPAK